MVGGESWEWTDRQAEVKLKNTLTGNTEKRRHTRWMSVQQERNIHTYFHIIYFQIGYAFRWCSPCLSTALFPIVLIHWYSFCLCVCVSTISWIFVTGNVDLGSLSRSEWTGCTGLFIAVMFYANAQSHMCMDLTFQIGTPATTGTRTTQLANTLRLRVEEHNRER